MKEYVKCFGLFVVGLLTAVIIYPFLHELGHVMMAYIVGAEVMEVTLLPLPSILCNMGPGSKYDFILVGVGGMLLPYIITEIRAPKNFWLWYIWVLVKGISLLAFAISCMAIVSFRLGRPMQNEDITKVLQAEPANAMAYMTILLVLLAWGIYEIVKTRPVIRCLREFNVF